MTKEKPAIRGRLWSLLRDELKLRKNKEILNLMKGLEIEDENRKKPKNTVRR